MSAQPEGRRRRDPRAEREQRRRGGAKPPATPAAEAPREATGGPARRRVDPRSERGARRLQARGAAAPSGAAVPQTGHSGPVVIEDPACWILVVPDQTDGSPDARDRELLGAARQLADAGRGAVVVLDLARIAHRYAKRGRGDGGQDKARESPGAQAYSTVRRAPGPSATPDCPPDPRPQPRIGELSGLRRGADWHALGADRVVRPETVPADPLPLVLALVEQLAPRQVLFTERPAAGAALGRRLAARLGVPMAAHVRRLEGSAVAAAAGQGREAVHEPAPPVLLLDAGTAEPHGGALHEARALPAPVTEDGPPAVEDLGPVPVNPDEIPLAEADCIVSAGRGVQDWDGFQRLAALLGAAAGASRPVCDAGLMPRARQVGASGTVVSARCYIALGISGAPQHLQGIVDCEHVVAVNRDPHSAIMKRADLAVVGDVQAVMAALLRRLEGGS